MPASVTQVKYLSSKARRTTTSCRLRNGPPHRFRSFHCHHGNPINTLDEAAWNENTQHDQARHPALPFRINVGHKPDSQKSTGKSNMKNCIAISCLAMLTGCTDFLGTDVTTTQPTQAQLARCRAEMYLQNNLVFQAHGMKLLGSGIDDQKWLKFSCEAADPAQIFQTDIVDVSLFRDGIKLSPAKDIPWWDVEGRNLFGGQTALPNARFMNVGIDATATGSVVYVTWFDT